MIYNFVYKTSCPSGKYYIGRHSTANLNDSYVGSGKWVRQYKDKSELTREILCFYESYEDLCLGEEEHLRVHVGNPSNMNFNNKSIGFAVGNLNPAHRPEVRKYRSELFKGRKRQPFSDIARANMSNGQFGRKHCDTSVSKRVEKNSRYWILTSPAGEVYNIKNLSLFCRSNNLDQGNMSRISKTVDKRYKGWTCARQESFQ
jgi:hypothetical protein